ncbi:tetratricopeptide repeat protein [Streptacidiphilus sp. EB103A]|uniref:tetratricopeptide repeat protein n=1 Tax=Streptacidiphilus sp. EB103A TaxID=3156275 RepID=UPI003511CECF
MSQVTQDGLRTLLAERSGLDSEDLFTPVILVPRNYGVSFPLTAGQAEDVLARMLDELRKVLPVPAPEDEEPGRGFSYLAEITDLYEGFETRRILLRVYRNGPTPARLDHSEEYDPLSERGWGSRPSAAPDRGGKPSWGWWSAVRKAGPRPYYRMPDPYAGEGEPPVDRALDLRERGGGGDAGAYRAALTGAVREDPRQIDCWAHLGNDALERADRDPAALSQALGYYQTGVAVAELSLPDAFDGVLRWGEMDNRPFHRALHGLGLTWWRLGDHARAAKVFRNSLWTNPDDNQGVRYLIKEVETGKPWHSDLE